MEFGDLNDCSAHLRVLDLEVDGGTIDVAGIKERNDLLIKFVDFHKRKDAELSQKAKVNWSIEGDEY